jgi:hypothetical protein
MRDFDQRAAPEAAPPPRCPQDLSTAGDTDPGSADFVRQAHPMPPPIDVPAPVRRALAAGEGLVRRSELLSLDVPRSTMSRWLHDGMLVSLANGIYADPAVVHSINPWARFRLRTRAFVMVSPPNAHAVGWSAIVMHRLSTVGDPPAVPTVVRPSLTRSGSNRTVNGHTRFCAVPDRWLGELDGLAVVQPAFAAVDLGRRTDRLTSLIVADAVAARDRSREPLTAALADIDGWSGAGRAGWAVRHCDGDAESPLESAGRYAFISAGLPPSRSNIWVGEYLPEFRLDHYWDEHRVGVEADGLAKYGHDPAAAIRDEKRREWRLQQLGIRVLRYGWAVALGSPHTLAGQVRRLLDTPGLPAARLRTWSGDEGRALLGLGPGIRERPRRAGPR